MFNSFRREREDPEVNLIPVMNLFVTLIPFLLLAAAFYHVGVVPTSLPSQTDGASDIAETKNAVTVNIHVQEDKIQVSAASAYFDEETLASLNMTIARKGKEHDLETLGQALFAIKQMYDESDTVILLPEEEIPYQDVVRILDTAREITLDKDTPDERKVALFPVVVLSRLV